MKPLAWIGVAVILAGAFVLLRGFSFTKDKTVMDVGPFSASVEERQAVPAWAGAVAVGVGIALVIAGSRAKGR